MDSKTTFGQICRRRRAELDMSQRTLGELVGLTGQMISQIESGRTSTTLDRMDAIAKALDMEVVLHQAEPYRDPLIDRLSANIDALPPRVRDMIGSLIDMAIDQQTNVAG